MHGSPALLLTQGSGLGNRSHPCLIILSAIEILRRRLVQRMGTSQPASTYQGMIVDAILRWAIDATTLTYSRSLVVCTVLHSDECPGHILISIVQSKLLRILSFSTWFSCAKGEFGCRRELLCAVL